MKYAYAVTCHKSQGGQWSEVYIDQGFINEDILNSDYYRWLYTALTRATNKVYLVNFSDEFFEE
ncbi:MAG: ATP-binding domain-containing protein [Flavobacteriales bacterium]